MLDFILHAVAFVAWLAYSSPSLAASKNNAARIARAIVRMVLSVCIGYGLGNAFVEVIL